MDDPGAGLFDSRMQAIDSVLKLRESLLVERLIDSIVHSVTRKHQIRPRHAENAPQTICQIRPCKFPAGMSVFSKTRDRFATESNIDDFGGCSAGFQPRRQHRHPAAVVGNAVAQENDPLCILHQLAGERLARRQRTVGGQTCSGPVAADGHERPDHSKE